MLGYYDYDGEPLTAREWSRLFQARGDYVRWKVDHTTVADGVEVSTVWIGLDHRWLSDEGPPLIFETRVFGGALDDESECYATAEEAQAGHCRWVELAALDAVGVNVGGRSS